MGTKLTMEASLIAPDADLATRRALAKERELDLDVALLKDWGVFSVASASTPGMRHQVKAHDVGVGGTIHLTCTCTAGQYRTSYYVPCVHAAAAARYMTGYRVIALQQGQFRRIL